MSEKISSSNKPTLPSGPPSKRLLIKEAKVVPEIFKMSWRLLTHKSTATPVQATAPIIVVPGFGADDKSTLPLRRFLTNHGYQTEGWGLGANRAGMGLIKNFSELSERWDIELPKDPNQPYKGEGDVPALCDRLYDRVQQRAEQLGQPVTLIGWSLGGFLAREVARDLPEKVSQVITLGSPVIGGPKYTAGVHIFKRLGQDIDWIEREVNRRDSKPIQVPITVIHSRNDAIVDFAASFDHCSQNVKHIEVACGHMAMGFNSEVWGLILESLATN